MVKCETAQKVLVKKHKWVAPFQPMARDCNFKKKQKKEVDCHPPLFYRSVFSWNSIV